MSEQCHYQFKSSLPIKTLNPGLNCHVILLFALLPRIIASTRIICFTTAGVKCRVAAVQSCPVLSCQCWYIFLVLPSTLSADDGIPLKSGLGCVRDVSPYLFWTESIKPSLLFSCIFVVFMVSKESPLF
jgi:hypothetical protein